MNRKKLQYKFNGDSIEGRQDVEIDEKYGILKVHHHIPLKKSLEKQEDLPKLLKMIPLVMRHKGFLYGESQKKNFGGWIAINKSTGEWTVCETPSVVQRI